jgi:hypothetical protein
MWRENRKNEHAEIGAACSEPHNFHPYIQARLPDMTTYTQTQLGTERPDDSLYARHLEDLTKLGINVDEVSTS